MLSIHTCTIVQVCPNDTLLQRYTKSPKGLFRAKPEGGVVVSVRRGGRIRGGDSHNSHTLLEYPNEECSCNSINPHPSQITSTDVSLRSKQPQTSEHIALASYTATLGMFSLLAGHCSIRKIIEHCEPYWYVVYALPLGAMTFLWFCRVVDAMHRRVHLRCRLFALRYSVPYEQMP